MLAIFQSHGIFGITTFWCHIFLIVIAIGCICFSGYWISIVNSNFWKEAINSSLLISNILLMIFSFLSAVFLILYANSVRLKTPFLTRLIAILTAVTAQIILCVILSMITNSETEITYQDLTDYCVRFFEQENVKQFLSEYKTEFSVHAYVNQRTNDLYVPTATFLGLWIPITFIFVVGACKLDAPEQKAKNKDRSNSLRRGATQANIPVLPVLPVISEPKRKLGSTHTLGSAPQSSVPSTGPRGHSAISASPGMQPGSLGSKSQSGFLTEPQTIVLDDQVSIFGNDTSEF
jgi:hypothetical protein